MKGVWSLVICIFVTTICEAQVNLTNGLVGYWNFDGNAQDSSGNGNHGTVNGATLTTDRCGRPDRAYAFDGIDDFVQAGNLIPSFQNASISVWVKTTDSPTGVARGIVSKPRGAALGGFSIEFTQVGHPGGAFKFLSGINTGGGVQGGAITASTINNGMWRHLVGTIGTVGGLSRSKVYLDGQFVAEDPFTPNTNISTQPIQIGREFAVAGQSGRYFKGDIDDTRIYDRVLSAAEVLALYNLEKCQGTQQQGGGSDSGPIPGPWAGNSPPNNKDRFRVLINTGGRRLVVGQIQGNNFTSFGGLGTFNARNSLRDGNMLRLSYIPMIPSSTASGSSCCLSGLTRGSNNSNGGSGKRAVVVRSRVSRGSGRVSRRR